MKVAREMRPDLALEGPMQYDAAVDPDIARQKVKGASAVAGRATVCIFPNLDTGNNTYKVGGRPARLAAGCCRACMSTSLLHGRRARLAWLLPMPSLCVDFFGA